MTDSDTGARLGLRVRQVRLAAENVGMTLEVLTFSLKGYLPLPWSGGSSRHSPWRRCPSCRCSCSPAASLWPWKFFSASLKLFSASRELPSLQWTLPKFSWALPVIWDRSSFSTSLEEILETAFRHLTWQSISKPSGGWPGPTGPLWCRSSQGWPAPSAQCSWPCPGTGCGALEPQRTCPAPLTPRQSISSLKWIKYRKKITLYQCSAHLLLPQHHPSTWCRGHGPSGSKGEPLQVSSHFEAVFLDHCRFWTCLPIFLILHLQCQRVQCTLIKAFREIWSWSQLDYFHMMELLSSILFLRLEADIPVINCSSLVSWTDKSLRSDAESVQTGYLWTERGGTRQTPSWRGSASGRGPSPWSCRWNSTRRCTCWSGCEAASPCDWRSRRNCFIRVEAGQLRGDGVHVFVLEDQYQIIKKFVF